MFVLWNRLPRPFDAEPAEVDDAFHASDENFDLDLIEQGQQR